MLDPLAGAVGYGDGRGVVGGASSAIRCRSAAVAAALAVPGGQAGREAAASGLFAAGRPVQSDRVTLRA